MVTMSHHVDAIESAYRSRGEGTATVMPRFNLKVDPTGDDKSKALKIGGAVLPAKGVMGSAMYAAGWSKGTIELWVLLYSTDSGLIAGIVHGQSVSLWKTGATAAVAAKFMANANAAIVGLFGTGNYARTQLAGLAAVRSLREVRCYSRTAEGRRKFMDWAETRFPYINFMSVEDPRSATEGVDVLVTITTSRVPVTSGEWITAGTHINAVGAHYPGMREIDTLTVKRSRVIVDDLHQAMIEKGEILIPLSEGTIGRDHILGDLGGVVSANVQARTASDQVTLFCSGGVPIEYIASCAMLLERATSCGVGTRIPNM